MKFIEAKDMNEGDMVSGVCYAAAAEDIIKMNDSVLEGEFGDSHKLTVIGYLVDDDLMAGARARDEARERNLIRRWSPLSDDELRELGAIRRRLGRGVV